MTRPRLILLIRCAVLAVGLWCIGAPWWLAMLSLMMPVFSSCCGTGVCNTICANNCANESWQVTIAGEVDSSCSSCADYNKTYNIHDTSSCTYNANIYTGGVPTSCGDVFSYVQVRYYLSGANTHLEVQQYFDDPGSGQVQLDTWDFGSIGTSPASCCVGTLGPNAITSSAFGTYNPCDSSAATCTIIGSAT